MEDKSELLPYKIDVPEWRRFAWLDLWRRQWPMAVVGVGAGSLFISLGILWLGLIMMVEPFVLWATVIFVRERRHARFFGDEIRLLLVADSLEMNTSSGQSSTLKLNFFNRVDEFPGGLALRYGGQTVYIPYRAFESSEQKFAFLERCRKYIRA